MLILSKRFAAKAFEAVSDDSISTGFADRNTESRAIDLVGGDIKTHYPLTDKALKDQHLPKVLAGDNTLRFTKK